MDGGGDSGTGPGSLNLEKYQTVALTKIKDEIDFCWVVENFSLMRHNCITTLHSPDFKVDGHTWFLGLYPKKKHVSIILYLSNKAPHYKSDKIETAFSITLYWMNGTQKTVVFTEAEFNCEQDGDMCDGQGPDNFAKYEDLVGDDSDTIRIECKIMDQTKTKCGNYQYLKVNSSRKIDPEETSAGEGNSVLAELWKNVLSGDPLDEMDIKVKEHVFKVQKIIMKASSKVFERMLSIPMVENETSSLEIEDFDKEIVQSMLQFIYTGKTTISDQNVDMLLDISEKYELTDLKSKCEEKLADILTFENTLSTLGMAEKFNAIWLKNRVKEFILVNKEGIRKTEEFQEKLKSNDIQLLDYYKILDC